MIAIRRQRNFSGPVLLVLISGLSLIACDDAPGKPGLDSSEMLENLIQQYVDEQERTDGRDPIFTAGSFEADIESQRALLNKVQLVGTRGLTLEQDTDRQLLIGLLETDIRSAQVQRRWENDPAMYVPSRQIGLLMDPDAPETLEQRTEKLAERFASLPGQLQQARTNLRYPPARFTQSAIFQVKSTL